MELAEYMGGWQDHCYVFSINITKLWSAPEARPARTFTGG